MLEDSYGVLVWDNGTNACFIIKRIRATTNLSSVRCGQDFYSINRGGFFFSFFFLLSNSFYCPDDAEFKHSA